MESRGGRNRNVENTHCVVLKDRNRGQTRTGERKAKEQRIIRALSMMDPQTDQIWYSPKRNRSEKTKATIHLPLLL